MDAYALLVAASLNAGTVLALASLGLLINEKAGVLNLGAEGLMLCAAIAGFATVVHTGSDWLGFVAGMGAGALLAAVFGVLVIWLGTNQYATGLALSLFGAGFSAFAGIRYVQEKLPQRTLFEWPVLSELPLVGPALFRQHPMVYLAVLLCAALVWFLSEKVEEVSVMTRLLRVADRAGHNMFELENFIAREVAAALGLEAA
jgi:simple sugar transport system permease protein